MTPEHPKFADREASTPPRTASPPPTVYEMTVRDVRALDRAAIDELGIPGIVLMENAAIDILRVALAALTTAPGADRSVTILCGPGNNGGDGLALARHLVNHASRVHVAILGEPDEYSGDAGINMRIIRAIANATDTLTIARTRDLGDDHPALVIDALFGTGLTRAPERTAAEAIEWIARARSGGSSVLSIDTPSGLDADTGVPLGDARVRADATVTLAALKPGLRRLESQPFVGELTVAGIGVPDTLLARFGTPLGANPGPSEP